MNIEHIRYRGDASDVDELFRKYNLKGIIEMVEEQRKRDETSFREQLLKDGAFALSRQISPRIFNLVTETKDRLGIDGDCDIFCLNRTNINAFAHVQPTRLLTSP